MFVCAFDGKAIGPGLKMNKVVVETRKKTYYVERKDEDEETFYETVQGFETVKEVNACDECAKLHGHRKYISML